MELFTQATALAAAAVLVITELVKLIPVEFTSRYPAWVNGLVSLVAAFLVIQPDMSKLDSIGAWVGTGLLIAVTAAISYNQFTSKLVSFSGKTTK